MEGNAPSKIPAFTGSIASAFPASLKLQAEGLGLVMGSTRFATRPGIEGKVGDEHLIIPYRIHHEGDEQAGRALNGSQSIMYSCLLTSHHDGHIRQRQLERILPVSECWVVPFVFQLAGEYVIEILNTCEAHFEMIDPMLYGTFIRDNPRYFQASRARMISYWDCYYRRLYKRKSDYVGFRLFDWFQKFAALL
jgi:hypothetical protein